MLILRFTEWNANVNKNKKSKNILKYGNTQKKSFWGMRRWFGIPDIAGFKIKISTLSDS